MSDHIGISTLAVTTDGYVIILHQNDKALTSTDRLTPSGSGSVDFSDLRPDSDFRETLKAAAERELREETNLPAGRIGHTEVIGFYRDLGRGRETRVLLPDPAKRQLVRNSRTGTQLRGTAGRFRNLPDTGGNGRIGRKRFRAVFGHGAQPPRPDAKKSTPHWRSTCATSCFAAISARKSPYAIKAQLNAGTGEKPPG